MNKISIVSGILLAGLGTILLLRKASGSNGDGGTGIFTFGVPSAHIDPLPYPPGGAYILTLECEVKNNSQTSAQRTLEAWWRATWEGNIYGPEPIYQPGYTAMLIDLPPGASTIFRYSGLDEDPPLYLLGRSVTYYYWLQDNLGNKSPEVEVIVPKV